MTEQEEMVHSFVRNRQELAVLLAKQGINKEDAVQQANSAPVACGIAVVGASGLITVVEPYRHLPVPPGTLLGVTAGQAIGRNNEVMTECLSPTGRRLMVLIWASGQGSTVHRGLELAQKKYAHLHALISKSIAILVGNQDADTKTTAVTKTLIKYAQEVK